MPEPMNRIFSALFGDNRHYPLEQHLFNTLSLLNGAANLGGALGLLRFANYRFLLLLHLGTGVLFLVFYYLSRFRSAFQLLYWPFVLLTLAFVFVNALENARRKAKKSEEKRRKGTFMFSPRASTSENTNVPFSSHERYINGL